MKAKKAAKRKLEGTNTPEMLRKKEDHEKLANTIKGLHWRLRKSYRANGENHETVWQQHKQNLESLKEYAGAMHQLATEHWDGNSKQWCRDTAVDYFYGDGLKLALAKDARRRAHEAEAERLKQQDTDMVRTEETKSCSEDVKDQGVEITATNTTVDTTDTSIAEHTSTVETTDTTSNAARTSTGEQGNDCDTGAISNSVVKSAPDVDLEKDVSVKDDDGCSSVGVEHSVGISEIGDPSCLDSNSGESKVVIAAPGQGKLRLLDVGSCYNPFQAFPEFDALGIDICPATECVYQCDFLGLHVISPLPPSTTSHENNPSSLHSPATVLTNPAHHLPSSSASIETNLSSLQSPVTELPSPAHHLPSSSASVETNLSSLQSPVTELPAAAFHVLVFSLLLEYLPSRLQRWECCLKAHSLLADNGLLVIITPDSHSLHRCAPRMKSWKAAIEAIGFRRWRYEKQAHIHCMAFRKTSDEVVVPEEESKKFVEMLYIPQDFTEDPDDKPAKKLKISQKKLITTSTAD